MHKSQMYLDLKIEDGVIGTVYQNRDLTYTAELADFSWSYIYTDLGAAVNALVARVDVLITRAKKQK